MGLMKPTRSAFKTVLSICIASREAEIGDNLVAKAVKVQYSRAFGLLITQLTYQLSAHPSRPTSKQRGREGQWKAKHMFSFRCISCCPPAFCSSMPPMSLPPHSDPPSLHHTLSLLVSVSLLPASSAVRHGHRRLLITCSCLFDRDGLLGFWAHSIGRALGRCPFCPALKTALPATPRTNYRQSRMSLGQSWPYTGIFSNERSYKKKKSLQYIRQCQQKLARKKHLQRCEGKWVISLFTEEKVEHLSPDLLCDEWSRKQQGFCHFWLQSCHSLGVVANQAQYVLD